MKNNKVAARLRRLLGMAAWGWAAWAAAQPADLVVRNGAIYTVEPAQPWVQALAVRGGRYVYAGDDAGAAALIGPDTRVIDLHGAMAMPGINDVHAHPLDAAYEELYACNLPPVKTFSLLLEGIAGCAKRTEPGGWIVGGAWDSALLATLSTSAALDALDRASAGHPVVLRDDTYHNRWVNSEVLQRTGIREDSQASAGGHYTKDPATGRLTGMLREFPSFGAVLAQIPPKKPEHLAKAAQAAGQMLNAWGITAVQEAVTTEAALQTWSKLDRESGLPVHLVASLSALPPDQPGARTGLALVDVRERYRSANVQPDFAKLMLDGVPPTRTTHFLQPYLPDQQHGDHFHGQSNYTLEQLVALLKELDRRGIAVKLHATGDGSVQQALDAIAQVRKLNGPNGPRHQIAHAGFIAGGDIARFRQLNVTADLSPMLWFPTGLNLATAAVIGKERAEHYFPVKSLVQAGALAAAGSDWPAGQPTANPWIGIEGMVTRRNPLGEVPGVQWAEQAVDLATALRIYTLNSAMAMGLERQTGSIAIGKSADFIVLDRNLFKVPIEQVHQVAVQRTFFQGRQVYPASAN